MRFKDFIHDYKGYFAISYLIGLLHDLGKMSSSFVDAATTENNNNLQTDEAHTREDLFSLNFKTAVDKLSNEIASFLVKNPIENIVNKDTFMSILINHHNIEILDKLSENNFITNVVFSPGCDGIDSGYDKGNVGSRGLQRKDNFCKINFGGRLERIDIAKFDDLRKKVMKSIADIINHQEPIVAIDYITNIVLENTKDALAETRIPSNDVILSDHLYSVASLSKSLMVKLLWEYLNSDRKGELIDWRFFKSTAKWQLFVVEWNLDRYIENARRMSDIVGRMDLLQDYKKSLTHLIEYRYMVGNHIFNDESRIVFLFPGFSPDFIMDSFGFLLDSVVNLFPEELRNESKLKISVLKEPSSNLLKISDLFKENSNDSFEIVKIEYFQSETDSAVREYIKNTGWKKILCEVCKANIAEPKEEEDNICRNCRRIRERSNSNKDGRIYQINNIVDIDRDIALVYIRLPIEMWLSGEMIRTLRVKKYVKNEVKSFRDIMAKPFEDFKDFVSKENIYNLEELWQKLSKFDFHKLPRFSIENFNTINKHIRISSGVLRSKLEKVFPNVEFKGNKDILYIQNAVIGYILEELFLQSMDDVKKLSIDNLIDMIYSKSPSPSRLRRIISDSEEFLHRVSMYPEENSIKHRVLIRSSNVLQIVIPQRYHFDFISYCYKLHRETFPLLPGKFPIFIFLALFPADFPLYVSIDSMRNLYKLRFNYELINKDTVKRYIDQIDNIQNYKDYRDFFLNFYNKDGRVINIDDVSDSKEKFRYYKSVFDFIIFDSPDRRFETLNYEDGTFYRRFNQDLDMYTDRYFLEDGELENIKKINQIFNKVNTASVYKFIEVIYKAFKSWNVAKDRSILNTWLSFVDDSINNFLNITEEEKSLIKKYCKNFKIFELFEYWKYINDMEVSNS